MLRFSKFGNPDASLNNDQEKPGRTSNRSSSHRRSSSDSVPPLLDPSQPPWPPASSHALPPPIDEAPEEGSSDLSPPSTGDRRVPYSPAGAGARSQPKGGVADGRDGVPLPAPGSGGMPPRGGSHSFRLSGGDGPRSQPRAPASLSAGNSLPDGLTGNGGARKGASRSGEVPRDGFNPALPAHLQQHRTSADLSAHMRRPAEPHHTPGALPPKPGAKHRRNRSEGSFFVFQNTPKSPENKSPTPMGVGAASFHGGAHHRTGSSIQHFASTASSESIAEEEEEGEEDGEGGAAPSVQVRRSTIATLRAPGEASLDGDSGPPWQRGSGLRDSPGSRFSTQPRTGAPGEGWGAGAGLPPVSRLPHSSSYGGPSAVVGGAGGRPGAGLSLRLPADSGAAGQWPPPPGSLSHGLAPQPPHLPPSKPGHRRSRSVGLAQVPLPGGPGAQPARPLSSGATRVSPPRLGKSKLAGDSPRGPAEQTSPPNAHFQGVGLGPSGFPSAMLMMPRSSSVGGSSGALRKSLLTSAAHMVAADQQGGAESGDVSPQSPAFVRDLSQQFGGALKIRVHPSAGHSPLASPFASPKTSFGFGAPSPRNRLYGSYAASPAGSRPSSPRSLAAQQEADRVRLSLLQGLFPQSGYSTPAASPRVGRAVGQAPSLAYFGPIRTPNVSDFYRVDPGVMGGAGPGEEEWGEEEYYGEEGYYEGEGQEEVEEDGVEEVEEEEEEEEVGEEEEMEQDSAALREEESMEEVSGSQPSSRVEASASESGSMVEREEAAEALRGEQEEQEEEEEEALRERAMAEQEALQRAQQQQLLEQQRQQEKEKLRKQQQEIEQQMEAKRQREERQRQEKQQQEQLLRQQQQEEEQRRAQAATRAQAAEAAAPAPAAAKASRHRVEAEDKTQPSQANVLQQAFSDLGSKYRLVGKELGRGNFGVITACERLTTGDKYACKSVSKKKLECWSDVEDLRREVAILQMLRGHENIVSIRDAFEDEQHVHIITELCEGGELFDRIVERKYYTERASAKVLRQVAEVLQFCHARGVCHRDLKPENVLLVSQKSDTRVKVIDFGMACFIKPGERCTQRAGTPNYIAPEVITKNYGFEADVWSAGVILYVLLCGLPPFWGDTTEEVFKSVLTEPLDFETEPWPVVSAAAKDLVRRMLTRRWEKRITVGEILRHPWIMTLTGP